MAANIKGMKEFGSAIPGNKGAAGSAKLPLEGGVGADSKDPKAAASNVQLQPRTEFVVLIIWTDTPPAPAAAPGAPTAAPPGTPAGVPPNLLEKK